MMVTNKQEIFNYLIKNNKIEITHSSLLDSQPSPVTRFYSFDRIEGMMLGLAIGDALGNTSEGMTPRERKEKCGVIKDYLPNRHAKGKRIGLPSDDTQLAFWTLEQLLEDDGFEPNNLAKKFCRRNIFGIGSTVREFIANYKSGKPWHESGPHSAGNGALMRIAPMLIPHLNNPSPQLWRDTVLSSMMTHNDSGSNAVCVSFVYMLWELISMEAPPNSKWWLDTYVSIAKNLETDKNYTPRGGAYSDYEGLLWHFVDENVRAAFDQGLSIVDACNSWYSGAYLLETIPSVIYILMKYGNHPEEAIVRAVNDTKDNDSIAAIVGAAVGALHGKSHLPAKWISNHSGRTEEENDGNIFKILRQSYKKWGISRMNE